MHPWQLKILKLWNTFKLQAYRPVLTDNVNHDQLVAEIARTLQEPTGLISSMWQEYSSFASRKKHREMLGQIGTLSTEEAFVLHAMIDRYKPAQFIEIGTHEGKSTRRILDSIKHLKLQTAVTCFDIEDHVQHFEQDEARLILEDVTPSVDSDVLDAYEPGIIYLDAHPWQLLTNVIEAVLNRTDWILAVHDCGSVLCNPEMTIPKDEPSLISMRTGHWERYVLAASLGLDNPLDTQLNAMETETHLVRIFPTQHGLALILPKAML